MVNIIHDGDCAYTVNPSSPSTEFIEFTDKLMEDKDKLSSEIRMNIETYDLIVVKTGGHFTTFNNLPVIINNMIPFGKVWEY